MKRFKTIVLAIVLLCLGRAAQAQGHDSHWIFGNGNHVQFSALGPVLLPPVIAFESQEAIANISDKQGNLVLFSNNEEIWGSDLQIIPGTEALDLGEFGRTMTNGCIALPWPGDSLDNLFVVFYTEWNSHRVRYTLFDKRINTGKTGIADSGSTEGSFINIPVWSAEAADAINAVRHGNGRDWWIVSRTYPDGSDSLIIALLTPKGIEYTSAMAFSFDTGFGGEMSFSPAGDKLGISCSYEGGNTYFALYAFDRCDGQATLMDTLLPKNGNRYYGVAFSPDGRNIYTSSLMKHSIFKLNFIDGRIVDTIVYRFPGDSFFENYGGQLQLAPDGKIYHVSGRVSPLSGLPEFSEYLAVITEPNRGSAYCGFDTFGLYLEGLPSTGGVGSLPNFPNYDLGPLIGSPCDTLSPLDITQTSIPVFPQGTTTWSVIPTISEGLFTIQGSANGTVMVYDLYGREVFRKPLTNAPSFDLSTYPPGLYWVTVQSDHGIWYPARKIIRQ